MNGGTMTACNTMVNTSENQTIDGIKTFSNISVFSSGASFSSNSSLGGNAQLVRNAFSTSWYTGRNAAMIRNGITVTDSQYCPVISTKTSVGTWDIGGYTGNNLHFTYITDDRYNNGPNGTDGQITFGTGAYRTVTEMPLGFITYTGPFAAASSIYIKDIPYVGGTPRYVKMTFVNRSTTSSAKIVFGNSSIFLNAKSSSTRIQAYNTASSHRVYMVHGSLYLNIILY